MGKVREEQMYDLRTLEHLIRKGAVSPKDYQAYLKTLPNSESNAEYIEIKEEPASSSDPTMPEGKLTFQPVEPVLK